MTKVNDRIVKYAQGCSSRECAKNYKDEIDKKFGCDPVTPHIFYRDKREVKCMYCGKITKLPKNN